MVGPPDSELVPDIPGFRVEREIGRGATSRVYAARQEALDRRVAVKVITTLGEKGRRRALRLFREARLAGALDHPGLVRGIDAGAAGDFCWFAMELVEGRSLEQVLVAEKRLPVDRVLALAEQVLQALDHAHRRGVVHRDVKPANILVDAAGRARLLDLGLARRDLDPRLTDDTASLGTPLYMSPEQAQRADRVDARSDVFSVGATVYRALCGRAPFEAANVTTVLTRLLYEDPEPPSQLVRLIPPEVDAVVLKALAKDARRRYPTAAAFAEDVHRLRAGQAPAAAAPAAVARTLPRVRWAAAIAVVAGAGIVVSAWRPWRRDLPEEPRRIESTLPRTDPRVAWEAELRALAAGRDAEGARPRRVQDAVRARELIAALGPSHAPWEEEAQTRIENAVLEAAASVVEDVQKQAAAKLEGPETGPVEGQALIATLRERVTTAVGEIAGAPPPLQRLIEDRVLAALREFADAAKTWRAARVQEAVSALEALGADPRLADAEPSTIEQAIEDAVKLAPDAQLDDDGRRAIRRARDRAVDALLVKPATAFAKLASDAEAALVDGRLADAGVAIASSSQLPPRARVEPRLEILRQSLAAAIEAERARLQSAVGVVRRTTPEPTGAVQWEAWLSGLQGAVEAAAARLARLGEDEGAGPAVAALALARALAGALGEAAGMRARVPDAVQALANAANGPPSVFVPVLKGDDRKGERRLEGMDADGSIRTTRVSDRIVFNYATASLTVPTVAAILDLAGRKAGAEAVALLCYLEAEDGQAEELARKLPDSPIAERIRALARDGVELSVNRWSTAAEQKAARELIAAQRLLAEGRVDEARAGYEAVAAAAETAKAPQAPGSFWSEKRRERSALHEKLERFGIFEAWKPLDRWMQADPESGQVVVRIPLDAAADLEAFDRPPDSVHSASAIEVRAGAGLAYEPPPRHPSLRLPVPKLAGANAELHFDLEFAQDAVPAFVAISLHDLCFLGVQSLRDHREFLGEPLHGLERGLTALRRVERAAVWKGELKDYLAGFAAGTTSFTIAAGEPVHVVLTIKEHGQAVTLSVGGSRFELPRSAAPRLVGDGLRIAAYPTWRVRGLRLTATLPMPAPK